MLLLSLSSIPAYLIMHLGVYTVWLRHLDIFRQERPIFLYHLASWFLGVGALTLIGWALLGWAAAGVMLVLAGSLHGIYSLSFLELWSLSQGSYSLSILTAVERDPTLESLQPDAARLGAIGQQKRTARLVSLQRLGLLNTHEAATPTGRMVAALINGIITLSNGRNLNR